MPAWNEITKTDQYQRLPEQARAKLKAHWFMANLDPEIEKRPSLKEVGREKVFQWFMQQPDDTGQGFVSSTLGSAARGFGEVVPGAIEGVGALTGIEEISGAGQAVRGVLEDVAPVNPIYEEGIPAQVAGVGGQVGSLFATAGVGGLAGKGLAGAKIAAGATAAEQAALAAQAVNRGAKAASYLSAGLQGAAGGAQEAERYGLEGPEAYLRTLAGAATELGSEALPFGTLAETAAARRLLGESIPNAPGIRQAAFSEGMEEAAAQMGGNVATQALAPLGAETPGLFEGVPQAGALGAVGGGMLGAVNRLTTPTPATPPPASPLAPDQAPAPDATDDVAANVAAADEGEPDLAATPDVGTPVTLNGLNYTVTIPPGSGVSPDAVAGFYDDPETLQALHDRGDIRLEQVIAPTETVDTADLNNNIAASAAFAPQVVETMKEIAASEGAERNRAVIAEAAAKLRGEAPSQVSAGLQAAIPQTAVTTATETPVTPAESDGGSQGQMRSAAEGSISTVTEPTVPQEQVVSSAEIAPAGDPFAAVGEPVAEESRQTFAETPDTEGGWRVTDQLGGEAFGSLQNGVARIVGMDSVPLKKRYLEEGGRLKRRGFFRSLINTLKSKGARSVKISMQSADTRKALARLVETGELTNPRELAGISVDEHPTLFDIPQPVAEQPAAATPAPIEAKPKKAKRPKAEKPAAPQPAPEISDPPQVASVADASPITDANIDSALSEDDKQTATEELGGKSWADVREEFKKSFANFLNGASNVSQKLLEVFKRLASTMKSIAVTSAFFFTGNNSSYVQSFNPAEVAEVSSKISALPATFPSPRFEARPAEFPQIEPELIQTPPGRAAGVAAFPKTGLVPERPKADFGGQKSSKAVQEIASFVVGVGNNEGYPFVVADKKGGLMYVFDASGKLTKKVPALFGKEIGDITDLRSDMESGAKVTPAGRFFANPSADAEYGFTLDFVEGDTWNLAIHKVYLGDPSEQRMKRIRSQTPLDNRISYGCINLDETAMAEVIEPLFAEQGGFVYVLPETEKGVEAFNKQIGEQVFPLRPKFEAGETVTFKVNGQPVIGTIKRVSGGGNATVSYNWNGKKEQEIVLRTSEIQRPVLAVAEEPTYKYTQEQNARKAARFGLPTEPGVTVNAADTIKTALDRIASDTAMPQMSRAVARALQKQNYDGVDLRIEADGRRWYAGYYLNDNGITEIGINLRLVGRGQVDAVSVFLHEALHHVTLAKVRDPQGEIETQAVEALDTLRKRIRAYAGMQQKATKFSYELGSVDEFITALFTRPDFQDFIAGIPDTFAPETPGSKFRSVLSEIFRIIAQLVTGQKVQKGGILDQAFASTLALFETPQRAARGQSVDYAMAEKDAEYMAAVEAGDMAKAQQMVDEAAKRAIESNPRNSVKFGRFLGKSEYESARERIEELPREVFYVGNVEVIRNPTGDDIRGMTNEERSARGGRRSVDPDTRFTKDNYGNTWRWKATGGMHSMIEPSISRREGVEVNQNNGIPYHSDLVKDAIRSGEYIPSSTLSEYPNYADFVKSSSADPVTYDNDGNVIPLSQRFQTTSPDIRFSATGAPSTAQPTFTPDEARAILTKRFGKAVADKFNIEVMAPRRMGNREVEVDAELRGGTISLNLKFMDSEELLIQKAEHEMAHAVYTNPAVQEAWQELSASMPPDVRARITGRMEEAGYDSSVLDEEVLVRFFEEVRAATPPSKWKAFMDAVIDAFRRLFGATPDERTARLAAARIIAAGEAAVARGLDPMKQAFGQSVSDLLGKMDAEYMAAVKAGDMEKAQRMVDEAAKAAGYNVGPVLHGTKKDFTEFKESEKPKKAEMFSFGFHFTDSGKLAGNYGPRVIPAYLNATNPLNAEQLVDIDSDLGRWVKKLVPRLQGFPFEGKRVFWLRNELDRAEPRKLKAALTEGGYDSLMYKAKFEEMGVNSRTLLAEGDTTIVFRPEQIKSADPVTRDNDGNVIPLSKRFGPSPDIRFSVHEPRKVATQRTGVITDKYPGTINLEAARSYPEQVKAAQDAITRYKKESQSKDKIQVLIDARESILLDRDIPISTKMVAFDLLAQQGSILANLAQAESGSQVRLDDYANLTATANGVLESDPGKFADFKFTTTDDLARMATEAGRTLNIIQMLARLTPEGFIRSAERVRKKKVDAATEQQFGTPDVMSEIEKLWRMMQEAGATDRGLAIAAALRAFMPSRKNAARLIDSLFPQAGIRDRMTKGGEGLVRDFFQMIAGPRDPKGPLAEFDESIQSALSSMLRKVMEARGLVAENQTAQATDIDKLVRSVSADPLRFDKIAAADAAMQDELAKIEDAERRATLQQAWEEATSKMYTNIANEATLRRAVNAELKTEGVRWNEMFDKGQKPAALRAKVVDAVMQKVGALTDATDPTVKANLGMLRSEVGAAFDFIAETKRVQWLAYRAGIEARRRVNERRKDMLAALRNRGVAESALMRLNEKLAGPQRPGAEPNPVSTLIGEHLKEPIEGFTDKLVALGVERETADALDAISATVRADLSKLAEANAVERLTKSLKPKTKAAKSAIPRLLRVLLEAGKTGAFDSKAFNDALGEAFGLPPMTAEQEKEVRRMVSEINKLPQGAARVDKQQELMNYMALVQGVPVRDMLLSMWYANVLSGISTQAIGLTSNTVNIALRSFFLAITNNPTDFKRYLQGALGVGSQAGIKEVQAALGNPIKLLRGIPEQTRAQFKIGRLDSPEIANALEVLFRKGPTTIPEWVAYIGSGFTRMRAVFRIMSAIDAYYWNSAREGMYHLAASRTVRQMAKERKMTEEEANAEFIRQLGGGPEAYEEALREAEAQLKKAGQPADMLTMDRMAREAIDRARSQINPEAVQAANRWADRIVLQQEPEGVGKLISSLIRAIQGLNIAGFPLGQMLVPFNKIVSNLFEQSLDYTGLGLVRGIIGMHISDARIKWDEKGVPGFAPADNARMFSDVERRERAMAGFLGLTLSAAAYLAAKANMDDDDDEVPFMIYAFGPTDKNKREQMPDGWVPFSIKVGDTYYRYAEWPLGMVLAGFGAALDAERYGNMKEKDTMERIGYSAMLGLKGFMTQGVLSNVDTAIDVLMFKATGKKYTDIPVNAAKGVIPAQGFLRDISGVFDNTKISNDDITSALIRDLPFVKSLGTRPELNVFGEPTLVEGEAILRRFLTERRPHAEADYLSRNKLYIPGMDETVTIGQYLPPTERDRFKRRAMQMAAMENGVFTPEQNYNFRKRAGELTKAAVQRIMKAAPDIRTEEQRKAVQNLIEKQVGLARRRAMVEAVPYQPPPAQ